MVIRPTFGPSSTSARFFVATALVAAAASSSCTRPASQLVVVVSSDLLPVDLQCVHVAVARVGEPVEPTERWFRVRGGEPQVEIPFSFGVTAPDGEPSRRVEITVSAVRSGCDADLLDPTTVSTRDRVRTGFLSGQSLRVSMVLSRACVGLMCPEGSECRQGTCRDPVREPGELEPIDQGGEIPPMPEVNVAFVSRGVATGALGGLAGADALCASEATAAGLEGTFRAFLALADQPASSRLGLASGWIRTDRRTVAESQESLASEPLVHPLSLDAWGARISRSETIWTGRPGTDCLGWTSSETSQFGGSGDVWSVLPDQWNGGSSTQCDWSRGHVFCFQVDHETGAPPDISGQGGRRSFVSDELPGSPDEVCEMSRARAGLGGTFHALVARDGRSALSTITLDERPWVRMDGRTLFLDAANVRSDLPRLPVLFDAAGVPAAYRVATGASDRFQPDAGLAVQGTAEFTCNDWAPGGTGRMVIAGAAYAGGDWFNGGATADCPVARRFYCLED